MNQNRNKHKHLYAILGAAAALTFTSAPVDSAFARGVAMMQPVTVKVARANGNPLSMDQMRTAVIAGSRVHHWTVAGEEPGLIHLHLVHRTEELWVDVMFDTQSFTITYKKSNDAMGYVEHGPDGVPEIDNDYNRWVRNLNKSIAETAQI